MCFAHTSRANIAAMTALLVHLPNLPSASLRIILPLPAVSERSASKHSTLGPGNRAKFKLPAGHSGTYKTAQSTQAGRVPYVSGARRVAASEKGAEVSYCVAKDLSMLHARGDPLRELSNHAALRGVPEGVQCLRFAIKKNNNNEHKNKKK